MALREERGCREKRKWYEAGGGVEELVELRRVRQGKLYDTASKTTILQSPPPSDCLE